MFLVNMPSLMVFNSNVKVQGSHSEKITFVAIKNIFVAGKTKLCSKKKRIFFCSGENKVL